MEVAADLFKLRAQQLDTTALEKNRYVDLRLVEIRDAVDRLTTVDGLIGYREKLENQKTMLLRKLNHRSVRHFSEESQERSFLPDWGYTRPIPGK